MVCIGVALAAAALTMDEVEVVAAGAVEAGVAGFEGAFERTGVPAGEAEADIEVDTEVEACPCFILAATAAA